MLGGGGAGYTVVKPRLNYQHCHNSNKFMDFFFDPKMHTYMIIYIYIYNNSKPRRNAYLSLIVTVIIG